MQHWKADKGRKTNTNESCTQLFEKGPDCVQPNVVPQNETNAWFRTLTNEVLAGMRNRFIRILIKWNTPLYAMYRTPPQIERVL